MNFTKGEWKVDKDKFGDYGIIAQNNLKHSAIADVLRHYDNSEANAHLIAASPTMFKALKMYQDHQKGTRGHYCWECEEAINAAVEQAEGNNGN